MARKKGLREHFFGDQRGTKLNTGPITVEDKPPDYTTPSFGGVVHDPLRVEDGRARIMLTESWEMVDGKLKTVYHVDYWNLDPQQTRRHADQIYHRSAGALLSIRARSSALNPNTTEEPQP